jgi:protein MpaA
MKTNIKNIGHTVLGQSIDCWNFQASTIKEKILIIGGVHGDESEGILIANSLIKKLLSLEVLVNQISIIPCLNKDGEFLSLRSNYNDVDLNRNVPTKNWVPTFTNPRYKPGISPGSEPETIAFLKVLTEFKPTLIISLHSFSESLILYNPGNGKFDSQVNELSSNMGLKLVDKMPYEVLGSLNTLGKETHMPVITIEAPRDASWDSVKEVFIENLYSFILGL